MKYRKFLSGKLANILNNNYNVIQATLKTYNNSIFLINIFIYVRFFLVFNGCNSLHTVLQTRHRLVNGIPTSWLVCTSEACRRPTLGTYPCMHCTSGASKGVDFGYGLDVAFELDKTLNNIVRKVMLKRGFHGARPPFPDKSRQGRRILHVVSDSIRVWCYGNGEWRVVNTGQKPRRTMISMRAPAIQQGQNNGHGCWATTVCRENYNNNNNNILMQYTNHGCTTYIKQQYDKTSRRRRIVYTPSITIKNNYLPTAIIDGVSKVRRVVDKTEFDLKVRRRVFFPNKRIENDNVGLYSL